MAKTTKNFKQLLEHYQVKAGWAIESNFVYPMDRKDVIFHGYVPQEDIEDFVKKVVDLLDEFSRNRVANSYIANKYAIPFMQVGHMRTIETFFYYQHDGKTWLISLKEETTDYLG